MAYDSINPGKVWLDTKGERIQAHGGSILYEDGVYYWYGENKEKSLAGSKFWHWGVKCYRSTDLYNWEDLGIICPANTDDPDHPLHYTQYMDRPHIIFNEKTKKYVLWMKIMGKQDMNYQFMYIMTADKITGPYTEANLWDCQEMLGTGDFDLVKDTENGKVYLYCDHINFNKCHSHIACFELNEDYTGVTGEYTLHMDHPGRFIGREAPSFFERNGKKYIAVSQTTGYFPNPTECYVSDNCNGPWENLGYIHVNDTELLSFRSQISSVFKHPEKKNLWIALADRWLTNMPDEWPKNWLEIRESLDNPDIPLIMSEEEYKRLAVCNTPDTRTTALADYVWLPIEFDGDKPYIKWYDSWKIEDFE